MKPRATHILLLLDYGIGMFFALSIFVFGTLVFAVTGMPKPYEMNALGGAYTAFLANIERSARDLRADFCARADAAALAEAHCWAPPRA